MINDNKIKTGKLGEKLATSFLVQKGLKILDKNYYTRYGEIDLIAQDGDQILFFEVKARTSSEYGFPEIAVDQEKIQHLTKAISIYLRDKKIDNFWRLDIISVELDKDSHQAQLRWFKDITSWSCGENLIFNDFRSYILISHSRL